MYYKESKVFSYHISEVHFAASVSPPDRMNLMGSAPSLYTQRYHLYNNASQVGIATATSNGYFVSVSRFHSYLSEAYRYVPFTYVLTVTNAALVTKTYNIPPFPRNFSQRPILFAKTPENYF